MIRVRVRVRVRVMIRVRVRVRVGVRVASVPLLERAHGGEEAGQRRGRLEEM